MSGKGISTKCVLIAFSLFALCFCGNASAGIIAEFTGAPDCGKVVNSTFTAAQAFDVVGDPNVTEIQLNMGRWSGSTGYVVMELRADSSGSPSTGCVAIISRPVSEVPQNQGWVSFKWPVSGTTLYTGRWWIVCKVTSGSDGDFTWFSVRNNPYNTGDDTKTSKDGGSTWPILQGSDINFKVFGPRTAETTTTYITATPTTVTVGGASTIDVTVRDSGANLVQGPGIVTITKTAGTLGSSTMTLSNGQASTTWTAPGSVGSETITATYAGHSYGGYDYNGSNNNTSVNVIAENLSTTTTLTLTPNSTTTRNSITVSVDVADSDGFPVTGGNVALSCSKGTFGQNSLSVPTGSASTTWTASNDVGTFQIKATYSGYNGGTIIYGVSGDQDDVTVDYTDKTTTTTLRVSPDYPYISKKAYVIVEVKDAGGNAVPGGIVQVSAPSGWFDATMVFLANGKGDTIWHAPSTAGAVTITGNYQQYTAAGDRYLTSSNNDTATVVQDNDSTGTGLSWMSEWNSDYSSNPLANSQAQSRGFTDKLVNALVWTGNEYFNNTAWEDDMKKSSKGGKEDDYMDVHDITWYNGHGNPDYITFIVNCDDKQLRHSDAYDAWGTKDADWVVFKSCKVMSHDSYWASTMNGIHLECGFVTNAISSKTFGKVFAEFLIKETVSDEPHKIHQAWFLAGDETHPNDRKQRVIGETASMFSDYIWGQGYVSPDPTVTNYYTPISHDVASQNPVADAGGPYDANEGQAMQLDGSGSSDPDPTSTIYYAWDLDTGTNTDSNDWDLDDSDEADDDADIWGRRPWWTFNTQGVHNIRLMTIDNTWNGDSETTTVTVNPPPPAPPPGPGGSPIQLLNGGGIEIVDDFDPLTLPTEVSMPLVQMIGTSVGYNEMMNIAADYGMSGQFAELDGVDNWNMSKGNTELIVNQYSGSVMFVDRSKAYIYSGTPAPLPTESEAIIIANNFIAQYDILCPDTILESVTDISTTDPIEKGTRDTGIRIPFQRRVNYRRQINVLGTLYPVVGPGGKITVMIDEYGDITMFNKICRHACPEGDAPLTPPVTAISEFHSLGPSALIGSSLIPECNRIEIDNVSLGYYEEDFVTLQNTLKPVYILDLTCEDDKSSQQVQVYMSALAPPLQAVISGPADDTKINYGEQITLSGSATGGSNPDPNAYIYQWYSDVDGLIGSGKTVQTSQLSFDSRENQVLPHVISLAVSDPAGFENTKTIGLTVYGQADFNLDGVVDNFDLDILTDAWLSQDGEPAFDPNVDLVDDDTIQFADYAEFAGKLGTPGYIPETEHWAVIVGISDYNIVSDLDYRDEDATDWYNYFYNLGYEHIYVFGDTNPANYPKYDGLATEANIKSRLQNVVNAAGSNDVISFIFSGHGGGNGFGESYLQAWDSAGGMSGEDGDIFDYEFAAMLEQTDAGRIFVFLDCCFSGGMGDDLLAVPNAPRIYATTSCQADGCSYEEQNYSNGAWSYWFAEAGLVNNFGANDATTMEECHVWADGQYNPSGSDEPVEFDGDPGTDFVLW